MLMFSIFFFSENGPLSFRTNFSVSNYSSALTFSPELRGKNNHRSLEFRPKATFIVLPRRAVSRIHHSGTHKNLFEMTILYFYLDILG